MTAREFQRSFEQQASYIDELKDLTIRSQDVNYFLNEGQRVFVNNRLKNIRDKNIDSKQRDIDEIRSLLVTESSLTLNAGNSTDQKRVYDLPANYYFLYADRSTVNYCNRNRVRQNRQLKIEELHEALVGTHTKPHWRSPISVLESGSLVVYRDEDLTFNINSVIIDYIRTFNNIDVINDVTSELDESVHPEIVQKAVTLLTQSKRDGSFQGSIIKDDLIGA